MVQVWGIFSLTGTRHPEAGKNPLNTLVMISDTGSVDLVRGLDCFQLEEFSCWLLPDQCPDTPHLMGTYAFALQVYHKIFPWCESWICHTQCHVHNDRGPK